MNHVRYKFVAFLGVLPIAASIELNPGSSTGPEFKSDILPLLKASCNPCHFPGGKVYDEYPFDDQGTVSSLGKKLFTRIKDGKQQALITSWLNTLPQKPDSIKSASRKAKSSGKHP